MPAALRDDRVPCLEQRFAEARPGRERAIARRGEEHALLVVDHPERADVVARACQQERAADAEGVSLVAVAAFPRRTRPRLARVREDEQGRRPQLDEIGRGEHAVREPPSAARRLRGIVVAVAREVHHVVLLERGEQRETPHAPSAEERHVDAGKVVEQAAEVLGLRAGLRKRLGRIGHEKDAQALPARGRLLRNPTRRDHLAPDTELRRQEVAAVVAQLPGNVHESLVETQVEVAGRRLAQQRARRLGQEVREDEPAHALQRTRRRRPAAAGRGGEVRRLAGEVTQEVVVDVRLAARDQRSPLGEIDEVAITLAEDGEMDRSARPVRHGTGREI